MARYNSLFVPMESRYLASKYGITMSFHSHVLELVDKTVVQYLLTESGIARRRISYKHTLAVISDIFQIVCALDGPTNNLS